jgi:3D (Asp-Asp-Asp) domain-containing protein
MFTKNRFSRKTSRRITTACLVFTVLSFLPYVIMAKNTYIITDNGRTTVIRSYFGDPEDALEKAGISLREHDSYQEKENGDGNSEITVIRAHKVIVCRDGNNTVVTTKAATVREVLKSLGLSADENVPVNVGPNDRIYAGMIIKMDSAPIADTAAGGSRSPDYAVSRIEEIIDEMGLRVSPSPEPADTGEAAGLDADTDSGNPESVESFIYESRLPEDSGGFITTSSGEKLAYSKILYCSATAYTTERQENKITATGTVARVGAIAVDPTVIPYGSEMYIVSDGGDWVYGYAAAEDCGGGIKGNKIDLFFDTYDECIEFGVRDAIVYILE